MLACERGLRGNVLVCQRCLRANVPACQRANISFLRTNVPINMPACLRRANVPNVVPIFQTFLLRNAKENFYTLLLYKIFYIILDIIVIHIICICIVHKNCIILHFYTSCHIKEKCVKFFFSFLPLVRNKNIKRTGFNTLHVRRVLSNFPQLKQLNKINNTCGYCDLLELHGHGF